MFDKIEAFLINNKSNISYVDFVRVKSETKSGYGFNLSSTLNNQNYYFHMTRSQKLLIDDYYLVYFINSSRCEGRLDVVSAVKVKTYSDLMLSLWANDNIKKLLIDHFFESSVFNHWLKLQLISELPDTARSLIEYLKPIPSSVINEIVDHIPAKLLPGCIGIVEV